MRVLLDTNIILDYLLEREPFVRDADALIQTIRTGQIQGYVTATTLTDIFYIARKAHSVGMARQNVSDILVVMEVCTVGRSILEAALSSNLSDFEDAVQLACAVHENLDAIITRDTQDFTDATLPILSAGELLQRLS